MKNQNPKNRFYFFCFFFTFYFHRVFLFLLSKLFLKISSKCFFPFSLVIEKYLKRKLKRIPWVGGIRGRLMAFLSITSRFVVSAAVPRVFAVLFLLIVATAVAIVGVTFFAISIVVPSPSVWISFAWFFPVVAFRRFFIFLVTVKRKSH